MSLISTMAQLINVSLMNDRNNPFKINKLCLMLSHGNERVEAGFCINLFIYNA